MKRYWPGLKAFLSLIAILAIIFGSLHAMRSSVFNIETIDIEGVVDTAPVDSDTITTMAAIPERQNLFELSLPEVEARLLNHEWIREVNLGKRFPKTVKIALKMREPKAIVQSSKGFLSYVDINGQIFGQVDPMLHLDLPLVSGGERRILDALAVIERWNHAPVSSVGALAALDFDDQNGFSATIVYTVPGGKRGRPLIHFGEAKGEEFDVQLDRLNKIFKYLISRRVLARRIWADAGKKVVVRIVPGS
jgi:hypothetical protein